MDITVLGNELRAVEGFYKQTVTDDITQKSSSGSMIRTALGNIAESAGESYSVKTGTVDIRSATTTNSIAGTVYTIKSGGGSPSATNKVDINPS